MAHTLGLCAALDEPAARQALPRAEEFMARNSARNGGTCLWGSTILHFGYLGAESPENARAVFPILDQTLQTMPRRTKNVLESFLRMLDQASDEMRAQIARHADAHAQDAKPSIRAIARKIQKQLGGPV